METQKSNQTRYYTTMLLRITIPTSLDIFHTCVVVLTTWWLPELQMSEYVGRS